MRWLSCGLTRLRGGGTGEESACSLSSPSLPHSPPTRSGWVPAPPIHSPWAPPTSPPGYSLGEGDLGRPPDAEADSRALLSYPAPHPTWDQVAACSSLPSPPFFSLSPSSCLFIYLEKAMHIHESHSNNAKEEAKENQGSPLPIPASKFSP